MNEGSKGSNYALLNMLSLCINIFPSILVSIGPKVFFLSSCHFSKEKAQKLLFKYFSEHIYVYIYIYPEQFLISSLLVYIWPQNFGK